MAPVKEPPPPTPPRPANSVDEVTRPASIRCLFSDAALYKRAIAECIGGPPPAARPQHNAALRSVQDFAELVGNDLEKQEQDVVDRFAQLAVDDWEAPDSDSDEVMPFTEEPEAVSEEESEATSPAPVPEPSPGEADENAYLPPERVISLLIEEFGPLGPEGQEQLILEADGAIIQDVVILVKCYPYMLLLGPDT